MRYLILAPVLVLFVACGKQVSPETITPESYEVKTISFSLKPYLINEDGPGTKISLQSNGEFFWASTDTIGVYPNVGSQVYFVPSTSGNATVASFDGGGWGFRSGSEYKYYSYYPFIGNIYLDRTCIPIVYTGQKQNGTSTSGHLSNYVLMWSHGEKTANAVNFNYNYLNAIIRPNLTLPAGTYTKLAITAPSNVFAIKAHYDLTEETPVIVADELSNQIQIDLENITIADNTQFYVYLMSNPVNLQGQNITVSVLNSSKKELQCVKTPSKNYEAGQLYGLGCSSWTEVPQSMGLIIDDWGDGGNLGGDAE